MNRPHTKPSEAQALAPLIGITCEAVSKHKDFSDYDLVCDHHYALAVKDAGGHPVLLPIAHNRKILDRYLQGIDGLVIVGGDDVDPRLYGETPSRRTKVMFHKRTAFETWLYRAGKAQGLPILGICYGMQLINVLEGGTLYQHLSTSRKGPRVDHQGRRSGEHKVEVLPRTRLRRILRVPKASVPTQHHQGVKDVAPGFQASAITEDGVVEAIEKPSAPEILAVQWHPERRPESPLTRKLFRAFVRSCARYQQARNG